MYTALTDLYSMLSTEWNAATVTKPTITYMWDEKQINLNVGDYCLLSANSEGDTGFALYGSKVKEDMYLTIDIRTKVSTARLLLLVGEVKRIVRNNVRKSGYVFVREPTITDRSLEFRKEWRTTIDVFMSRIASVTFS